MTQVNAAPYTAPLVTPRGSQAPGGNGAKLEPLPRPVLEAMAPGDLLGLMMVSMENMMQTSMDETQSRLLVNDERIQQALEDLMKKLESAVEEAKKDKGGGGLFGFVSKVVDAVVDFAADVVGAVVGTVADFVVDAVKGPIDILVSVIKGGNFKQALMKELGELGENGKTADSVSQFTKGVMKFGADVAKFGDTLLAGIEAGLSGEDMFAAMGDQVKKLYASFKENIVNNPGFWDVTGAVMMAVSVAGAVMSGGALAWVALGVAALNEVNKEFGVAEKAFGKDVGQWVSVGLAVGSSVLLAASGGGTELLKDVQLVTGLVRGAAGVVDGVETIIEGDRQADELELQADIKELRNRLQWLHRMTEELIDEAEDKTEARTDVLETGADLYALSGKTTMATVFRA